MQSPYFTSKSGNDQQHCSCMTNYNIPAGSYACPLTTNSDIVFRNTTTCPNYEIISTDFNSFTVGICYLTPHLCSKPHTHTHPHPHIQLFYGSLDFVQTTQVSRYQNKHSPTHTYHSLSASSIYCDPWHPPCTIYVTHSLFAPLSKSSLVYCLVWQAPLHTP